MMSMVVVVWKICLNKGWVKMYIAINKGPCPLSNIMVYCISLNYSMYEIFATFTVIANQWKCYAVKMDFIIEMYRKRANQWNVSCCEITDNFMQWIIHEVQYTVGDHISLIFWNRLCMWYPPDNTTYLHYNWIWHVWMSLIHSIITNSETFIKCQIT